MERPLPTVRGTLVSLAALPLLLAGIVGALHVKENWLRDHVVAAAAVWIAWSALVWLVVRRMEPNLFRGIGAMSAAVTAAILSTGLVVDRASVGDNSGTVAIVAGLVAGLVAVAMQWALARSDGKQNAATS